MEWLELTQVPPLAESLVEHINTFLRDYTTQWAAADPDLQPQVRVSFGARGRRWPRGISIDVFTNGDSSDNNGGGGDAFVV